MSIDRQEWPLHGDDYKDKKTNPPLPLESIPADAPRSPISKVSEQLTVPDTVTIDPKTGTVDYVPIKKGYSKRTRFIAGVGLGGLVAGITAGLFALSRNGESEIEGGPNAAPTTATGVQTPGQGETPTPNNPSNSVASPEVTSPRDAQNLLYERTILPEAAALTEVLSSQIVPPEQRSILERNYPSLRIESQNQEIAIAQKLTPIEIGQLQDATQIVMNGQLGKVDNGQLVFEPFTTYAQETGTTFPGHISLDSLNENPENSTAIIYTAAQNVLYGHQGLKNREAEVEAFLAQNPDAAQSIPENRITPLSVLVTGFALPNDGMDTILKLDQNPTLPLVVSPPNLLDVNTLKYVSSDETITTEIITVQIFTEVDLGSAGIQGQLQTEVLYAINGKLLTNTANPSGTSAETQDLSPGQPNPLGVIGVARGDTKYLIPAQ